MNGRSDVLEEAEVSLENGVDALNVARRYVRHAAREGQLEALRSLCDSYDPGQANGAFAAHLLRERESGGAPTPDPGNCPSEPLSKLYEALEGTALEYDLRPYTATGRFTLLSAPLKRGKSTFAALYGHAKVTGGTLLGQQLEAWLAEHTEGDLEEG